MLFQESETIELKEVVVDDIKKEIIAFANCDGGKLYIGIRDDGTVVGLDNADSVSLQISNMVRDAIKPDVTMFCTTKPSWKMVKMLLPWIFSVERTALIILPVKECARKAYMFARDILRFLRLIQQSDV